MNKRAIVMGATSGIGREVALLLARRGWHVAVAGRREDLLVQLAQESEGIKAIRRIDVNDPEAPAQLLSLIDELGGADLYFHSSGIGWQNTALDADRELATVETNAVGFTRMVGTAFRYMAEHGGGRIAAISSIARTRGLGAAPSYSATKRFQSHYLECLAQLTRIRRLNIRLTDIRPGFVATDLIRGSRFPLQLDAKDVARDIVRGLERGRSVLTIDWRYRLLVALWRLVPRWLWIRLRISRE